MKILDGRKLRDHIKDKLKKEVGLLKNKPSLAIIQVGERVESNAYIASKKKFAEVIGVGVIHKKFKEEIETKEIIAEIEKLNVNKEISGILVQLPIPEKLDRECIMNAILPSKDVDGLGPVNVKKLFDGNPEAILPATTKGILTLLEKNDISIHGKNVLVIGRSSLVGKPTALACLMRDATVTIAHSKTQNLEKYTKTADIIIVAAGKKKLLTPSHVLPHQVIIDVGINPDFVLNEKEISLALQDEIPNRILVGDVDFENIKDKVQAISPVPGGVGPMTVASLFENVLIAHKRSFKTG